ncbi:hypothetical protein ACWU37_21300 (plasmid) [Photobacterium damselae subsp. damselae]|uniref:hypothetical protein n=1 Tax=Photobacterium damselae TaxID=38293 RepID=UPI001F3D17FC|nr:hypothetical protein [Photobacterium damselae]UKA12853.1 hypothetical protein IHC91_20905 [Photobacterium damselae subsp. damselae]
MKKAIFSEKDNRGHLYVDCIECERGPKGSDADKCSSGSRNKKGHQGGCFTGILLKCLTVD